MKKLLLRVYANHDYSDCDWAYMELNTQAIDRLLQHAGNFQELMEKLAGSSTPYSISFFDYSAVWIEGMPEWLEDVVYEEDIQVLPDSFTLPDSMESWDTSERTRTDCDSLQICEHSLYWEANIKGGSEMLRTAELSYELLQAWRDELLEKTRQEERTCS